MPTVKIAIAQINCTVGDIAGNVQRMLAAAETARQLGADVLLTPELALSGYPPEDLLLRPDFYRACRRALQQLASAAPLPMLVGHPDEDSGERYNAASLLRGGAIEATYRKQRLPNYEVFDEARYFVASDAPCVVEIGGARLGINICADVWEAAAPAAARAAGAEILLVLNASPYHMEKQPHRMDVLRRRCIETGMAVIYANLVGGQDELVFDGSSFALDAAGALTHQLPAFVEEVRVVSITDGRMIPGALAPALPIEAEVYAALKLGVADYVGKNNFPGALIGLSGGIDSALTLCIAVDALGADKVRAVMMPSPYTAQMSLDDARALAANLGVRYDEIPIERAMEIYADMLDPVLNPVLDGAAPAGDTTAENLQARIRGTLLMALSNRSGAMVLTTGNKSEMAVGYATLYGDMAGGFAVIKDVFKTFVYRLARWRNEQGMEGALIPKNIITRPPSAELRPDQTDQDSLPPYEALDAIIDAYMTRDFSARQIVDLGYAKADVARVLGLLKRSEYKRRQAPPGIRITPRGFGKDWRYPITSRHVDAW